MAIDDGEIAQVRAATDIVALIGERVALKRTGRRWTGLCPFHAEKTPSFSVNAEQGLYYCFGCRASGDAIKFVRETQHVDFREALQLLADKAGIELHDDAASQAGRKARKTLLDAMAQATAWYHDRLLSAEDAGRARQYLRSRGIDAALVRRFQLGWAPDEWDALARSLGVPTKVLSETGLGFRNSAGRDQDFLRNRIVFPIADSSGHPIAVGGRILPPTVGAPPGRPEPKYKNSPETSIYSKRRTLYGLHLAKDDIIRTGEIVVCEGYTDVIGLFAAGVERAVATCGTALTEEHFRTLRNFARRIVLAYDADAAGQSAAASVYQWERTHEVDVAVARLPNGVDPGELAQRDPDALRAAVAEAVPYLQFRLDRVLEQGDLSSPEGRARAASAAVRVVAEHPTDLVRDQYLRTVADRCRVDVDHLRPLLEAERRGGTRPARPVATAPRTSPPASRPGRAAIALLVHAPESVDQRFVAAYFSDPDQLAVFEILSGGALVPDAIDELERRGEAAGAELLREVAVEEPREDQLSDRAIQAVAAQLVRAAAASALREIDRDVRSGDATPGSAIQVIRDVKARLAELEGPAGVAAEQELRAWLVSHEAARVP